MSIENVRNVLAEEVEFLAPLIEAARSQKGSKSSLAGEIMKSWGDYLRLRQKNNQQLLEMKNEDLVTALSEEADQLKEYLKCKCIGAPLPESWEVFLKCELDFLDKLQALNRE